MEELCHAHVFSSQLVDPCLVAEDIVLVQPEEPYGADSNKRGI